MDCKLFLQARFDMCDQSLTCVTNNKKHYT